MLEHKLASLCTKLKLIRWWLFFIRIFISLCNKFLKTKQKHKQTNKIKDKFMTDTRTNLCEYPRVEKRISPCADLHILLCISTCSNSLKTVQIRVRGNTLFLVKEFTLNCVSPHAVIHQKLCISAQRIYAFLGAFPQVAHTIVSVNPHMRKIKVWWISSSWEIHLFSCTSAWGNTLFLMREFTRNSVSTHAGIHWTLWKSTQRNYTFSGALPQVEVHNNKSISSYAETYILVNFLILENSHFLVYIRMR